MFKVLIIVIDLKRALEHEWFVQQINHDIFEIEFVLINGRNTVMEKFLMMNKIKVYHLDYQGKKSLISITLGLMKIMLQTRYRIVHTHLFEASLTGLIAAWFLRVPRRVTTRHSSDFHHVYFPSAVKYDKLISWLATDVVAISENVRKILVEIEHTPPTKVHVIYHGISVEDFSPHRVNVDRINAIRFKYQLTDQTPIIGVISRFIEWKGIQFIVPAFKKVLSVYPNAVLVLANANGPYRKQVMELLDGFDSDNLRIIEFENDIAALYRVFDVFVHVPISESCEAFGQIYLESLISSVPSVFTMSGVASEFAVDRSNCMVVPFQNSDAISEAILAILNDSELANRLKENGFKVISSLFNNSVKIKKLESLYLRS